MTILFIPMFGEFPAAQRDEENHWYDTDHVPQRLSAPGFLRAERWQRAGTAQAGQPPTPLSYLHLYFVARPEAVATPAYAHQFAHVTPRSALRGFAPTPPLFRDVWTQRPRPWEGDLVLSAAEGGPAMLAIALDRTAPGADALLDDALIPLMLACPGLLRTRAFDRTEVAVANPPAEHAPGLLLLIDLAGTEAVGRADYARTAELVDTAIAAAGHPLALRWAGAFTRRPSPWTVRPTPRG